MPFFVAMAQEWRNGPRQLREHDDDDDEKRLQNYSDGSCITLCIKFYMY